MRSIRRERRPRRAEAAARDRDPVPAKRSEGGIWLHLPAYVAVLALASGVGIAVAQELPQQPAIEVPPAPTVTYEVTFTPVEDETLATALRDASNLLALQDEVPPSPPGLIRRAQADLARLAEVLGGLGYFGGTVRMEIEGRPLNDPALPDLLATRGARPVSIEIITDPGEIYTFGTVRVEDADGGGPPEVPVSVEGLGLERGAPAVAATVLSAEAAMVAQMQSQGRPLARVAGRDAAIDRATETLNLTAYLDAGPQAGFGFVTIEGNEDVNTDFIASRIPFVQGELYDPAQIRAFRDDLVELGVFNSVRITTADQLDSDGNLPMTVTVAERPARFIGFGAHYSTDQGAGVEGYWGHRNLFGNAEQLRIDAVIWGFGQNELLEPNASLAANFRKPGFIWRNQTLVADLRIERTDFDAYTFTGITGFVGVEHDWTDSITLRGGIRAQLAEVEETDVSDQYLIVALPVGASIDTTDDPLDPTRGYKLDLDLAPTIGLMGSESPYLSARIAGSTYFDLSGDGTLILSARASIGSIVGAQLQDVPPQERFYAGGTETVRGYAFQSIGPKDSAGLPTGGLSVVTAGLEARYRFTETIGAVAFVEGGGVFTEPYPDFGTDIRYAAGIGGRYYTSLGPIRVDLAVPLNPDRGDDSFQIYISLGQAF